MRTIKFRFGAKHYFGLIAIMYPVLVFCAMVILKLPIRYLSIGIIIFAIAYSIINSRHYKGKHTIALFVSPLILCIIGIVSLCMGESPFFIKLYPALTALAYLTIMITSFFFPPPLAYYFIDIFDKTIKTKIPKEVFESYYLKASVIWCVFFFIDGIISVFTTLYGSDRVWGIYNGGVTYFLMGLIFIGEFIVLKSIEKRHHSANQVIGYSYKCSVCGYEYKGSKEEFEKLPADFKCPMCSVEKRLFIASTA
jgi:uncharacterized membrane protein/rubredoxin